MCTSGILTTCFNFFFIFQYTLFSEHISNLSSSETSAALASEYKIVWHCSDKLAYLSVSLLNQAQEFPEMILYDKLLSRVQRPPQQHPVVALVDIYKNVCKSIDQASKILLYNDFCLAGSGHENRCEIFFIY